MFSITIRERSGQVYTFHFDKPEVLIGRVKGNDVILPKQNISKRHTLVRVHGARFVVEDLGSTNGTYVNGHRIASAVEIGAEDKVYLGDFVMNFTDLGTGAEPPDIPAIPDMPAMPDLPAAGGSPRDQGLSGTMRAENAMSGVTAAAPQDTPAPVYEDQVLLGDLESLLATSESDYAQQAAHVGLDVAAGLDGGTADKASSGGVAPMVASDDPTAGLEELLGSEALLHKPTLRGMSGAGEVAPAQPVYDEGTRAYGTSPVSLLDGMDDRMTGPTGASDGFEDFAALSDEPAPASGRSSSVLGSIPGLAGALHPPPVTPAAPAPASKAEKKAAKAAAAAAAAAPAPAPVAKAPRLPTLDLRVPVPPPPEGDLPRPDPEHFDALAVLYRNALRDLRPSVPADASQMSDTDWAEMEDRVVAFVDTAVEAGDVAGRLDVGRLKRDLIYELAGLGPLEPMLDDPTVEAIEVNGPDRLFVFRGGRREPAAERFSCQQALAMAVDRLVRATGNGHAKGTVHADGTLVDGTSVHVVWPPLCPQGPAVLLRKPRAESPDLDALIARGTVTQDTAEELKKLVAERRSVAIVGVPKVGRRTVLNALAMGIEAHLRILVVEDGLRLRLQQEHVVRIDAAVHSEGLPSPLRVAQRLQPDWILLGETASVALDEVLTVGADGAVPWLGVLLGRDEHDLLERAAQALLLRHPGLPESVARARAQRAFDVIAVFTPNAVTGLPVLSRVVHVGPDGLDAEVTP